MSHLRADGDRDTGSREFNINHVVEDHVFKRRESLYVVVVKERDGL